MIKSEKPLLPYTKSCKDGSPSPRIPSTTNSITNKYLKDLFKKRKKFLLLVIIICLLYLIFTRIIGGGGMRIYSKQVEIEPNQNQKGLVDTIAKLKDIKVNPIKPSKTKELSPPSAANYITRIEEGIEITSELGLAAERSYKLGVTHPPKSYQLQLESFIRSSFPLADSNEANPYSLINAMRAFFPLPAEHQSTKTQQYSSIPKIIFQTAAHKSDEESQSERVNSWPALHPDWNITFHDNQRADEWVKERFTMESTGRTDLNAEEKEEDERGIVGAWNLLTHPTVLRSDFWRYLVVCSEGGVYADTDVEVLKAVDVWGLDPTWEGLIAKDYVPPSFIAGVEADVGNREDWALWYPRPLELSQWTFASARGHPILIDAIRRVVQDAYSGDPSAPLSVVERSGPGCFTDSVFRYLKVKYKKGWSEFRNLGEGGWRYFDEKRRWGDVKILSITGFSPGAGHMGSGEPTDRHAMSRHWFSGSWKGKNDGAEGGSR